MTAPIPSAVLPSGRPLAVVTGSSSGIGREIAVVLAEKGMDLVLTAEAGDFAETSRRAQEHGVSVHEMDADLAEGAGVEDLYTALGALGRPVDVLVLNAGIGLGGPFAEQDLERVLAIVDLNVRSTVHLARLVLADMLARNGGRILVTSSIASTMPGTFQAVYNASKSFLQSFTEAVAEEVTDSAVTLTSLMPGPTDTDFFRRAEMLDTKVGRSKKDDPEQVARQGVEAMLAGEIKVVGGSLKVKVQEKVAGVLPDQVKAKLHRSMAEPKN